jgi:heme/copper-type cytochrome/quinol oxidase subunit 2
MKTGIVLIVFGLVLSTGLGYYFGTITTSQQGETTTTTTSGSSSGPTSPYVLTLVITTANTFNSSVEEQSVYYVVGPNSLQSSSNITLPAHRLIEVVIMNYDEGNATLISPQYDNVNGTMSVVSNNVVNSSEGPSGIVITGTQTVISLPAALISHTFTMPQLNLNIPVAAETTVIAYFTRSGPGDFSWFCTTPCESGSNGLAGAMETPGWMSGSIVVS